MAPIVASSGGVNPGPGTEETIFGVPKWAVLAATGGVVVAGLAYYILKDPKPKKKEKAKKSKKDDKSVSNTPTKKPADQNVDDLPISVTEEVKDPAALAVSFKEKGNKYFKAGRYEIAISNYTQAIEVCPEGKSLDLSTFYQNRAAAHEQLTNWSSVIEDCSAALRLNPRYVKAVERRARALKKQSESLSDEEKIPKLERALEDITAACILEGFSRQDHMLLVDSIIKDVGRCQAKVFCSQRDAVLASSHFIRSYLDSFQNDPCCRAAEQLGDHNDVTKSNYTLALEHLQKGEFDKIVGACKLVMNSEAIENGSTNGVDGDHEDAHIEMLGARLLHGTFLMLSRKHNDAMEDFNHVISDPRSPPNFRSTALIRRASLIIQKCTDFEKDSTMCLSDFEEAIKVDPENSDVHFHLGQIHLLTDNVEKALSDFETANRLSSNNPLPYVQKLYTEFRHSIKQDTKGNISKFGPLFEEAIAKYPKCIDAYSLYAQILSENQQFDEAMSIYNKALKVEPNNPNILVHIGMLKLQFQGDIEESIKLIEKATVADPKCEFALETLGTIEVQRGNLLKAVEHFDKAIPLCNTELEMAHLFGLLSATKAQLKISGQIGAPFGMMNI